VVIVRTRDGRGVVSLRYAEHAPVLSPGAGQEIQTVIRIDDPVVPVGTRLVRRSPIVCSARFSLRPHRAAGCVRIRPEPIVSFSLWAAWTTLASRLGSIILRARLQSKI